MEQKQGVTGRWTQENVERNGGAGAQSAALMKRVTATRAEAREVEGP